MALFRGHSIGRPLWVPVGLAVVLLWSAGPARAAGELRKELAEVAKDVQKLLQGRRESVIAVGQFTGPANFPTSAGPGIAQVLTEELQKAGITVKARANLGIKGEYLISRAPGSPPAVRLKGTVEDESGKVITDFTFDRTIHNEADFLEMIGTTVEFNPSEPIHEKKLGESLSKPQVHIDGTLISAGPTSPYAVEVVVNGTPQKAVNDDGLAFVKIDRGDTYAVRLVNRSPHDAAVTLTIDGLNVFAFSELRQKDGPHRGDPLYARVIVPAKGSSLIKGWHKTNEVSDSFLVTEYAKSAAATLNQKAGVGTITATFAAAWSGREDRPKDEPYFVEAGGDATGFGPPVDAKFTVVKREIGRTRAAVSVRYTK